MKTIALYRITPNPAHDLHLHVEVSPRLTDGPPALLGPSTRIHVDAQRFEAALAALPERERIRRLDCLTVAGWYAWGSGHGFVPVAPAAPAPG